MIERGVVVLLVALFMCEFVVGVSYSEVKTNFVLMGTGDVDSGPGFFGMYGDWLIAGIIVLAVIVIYLSETKKAGKKRKK